jgi:hypothetical protein
MTVLDGVRVQRTERMVRAHCPDCGWRYKGSAAFTGRVGPALAAARRHAATRRHLVEVEDPRVIVYDGTR